MKMYFNEYIDYLNEYNANYSLDGQTYPKLSYVKIQKKFRKDLIYKNIRTRLINIALSMFKWGTPPSIDDRQIELGFLIRGCMCLFTGSLGDLMLPCIATNRLNVYGNPTIVRAYGWNGFNKKVEIKYLTDIPTNFIDIKTEKKSNFKGVFVRDNPLAYPYINYINQYAYSIADKIVALEIATQRLKNPFHYIVNERALKDTVEKLAEKIEKNEDVIIEIKGKASLDEIENSIKLVDNKLNANNIKEIRNNINFDFNMFLETLGINTNPSPDKSQVVLTPELESNNDLIDLEQDVRFKLREKFCKDAKEILGIDIKVEKNLVELKKEIEKTKGGWENDTDGEQGATE